MARRRRFSDEAFGATIERLMAENGITYRGLATKAKLSAGYLNHLVHGNRPVPSNDVIRTLAAALGVEAAHFREYRLRVITERLEQMPEVIDRLYRRFGE
jgi:transcriptional regulator with XRE-family HTH domain